MRSTKIMIKSLYGIKEFELDGKSVELSGKKGIGKTSVLDAIRFALTNKSDRDYIVRQGEIEGEILIETNTGLRIDRKARTNQADYKSVKQNGKEVGSPESFLRDIFTPLQLNPVEFLYKPLKEQNSIILDMIEYEWDLAKIKEWFGETPSWINYEQNILAILNDIQAENGLYFQDRQDTNRDIRNKKAIVDEIGTSLPLNYRAENWENASYGDIYSKIEKIRTENATIEKALRLVSNKNEKVRKFEADREISKASLERTMSAEDNRLSNDIRNLQEQTRKLQTEKGSLESKKADKLEIIEQKFRADISTFEAEVEEYKQYVGKECKDTSKLEEEAANIELMKSHINEYKRMVSLQEDIKKLNVTTEDLTTKIEKARTLPGEILENCNIPIEGLTVENGLPLINGLPISNLSDGEKLDLCIDVAIQKPNGLQIILIDGVEKLDSISRNVLYTKCKDKGLQLIATRTTDSEELTVIELEGEN